MPRFLSVVVALLAWGAVGGAGAWAQAPITLRINDAPLATALEEVRAQTALDLVYAERLVRGHTTSCTYTGADREAALACVLEGTDVQAERVRRGQYVLVSNPDEKGRTEAAPRTSLKGYVLDAETGERLPGAHVYLTQLKAGTTTNQDGYFVLSGLPPEDYAVRISYLGYRSVDTLLTAGGGPVRLALAGTSIQSEGVVVEAGSTSLDESERLPGMRSVALDRLDRLPSFGEPDLFRALQWTPGIRKTGVTSGGLSVRGGQP